LPHYLAKRKWSTSSFAGSFGNITVKKNYQHWSKFAEVIVKISGLHFSETWRTIAQAANKKEMKNIIKMKYTDT